MALRKHSGNTLTLTAPYNVSSGGGFKSGTIFAVAAFDALLGAQVEGMVTGVFNLATDGSTFVEGDSVYWVDSTQLATSTSSGNMFIGAVEIGNDLAPSGFVSVRLSAVFESLNVVSGGADGQLLVGKTGLAPAFATVSGDATISNAGALTISSAIRKVATVALSAADIKQLNGTPKALVASPGAGKVIVPEKVVISFTNGTQFANGSAVTPETPRPGPKPEVPSGTPPSAVAAV